MSKVQYKVTNVTKWPGAIKGKHKNGFIIAIARRNVHVGRHMVVNEVTEAIESFHKKKWVKIEAIQDRSVSIKAETEKTEKANEEARKQREVELKADEKRKSDAQKANAKKELEALAKQEEESEAASSVDKEAMKEQLKKQSTVKVTGEGNESERQDPTKDLEKPEYMDGEEPNFVVNASKKKGGRRKGNKIESN